MITNSVGSVLQLSPTTATGHTDVIVTSPSAAIFDVSRGVSAMLVTVQGNIRTSTQIATAVLSATRFQIRVPPVGWTPNTLPPGDYFVLAGNGQLIAESASALIVRDSTGATQTPPATATGGPQPGVLRVTPARAYGGQTIQIESTNLKRFNWAFGLSACNLVPPRRIGAAPGKIPLTPTVQSATHLTVTLPSVSAGAYSVEIVFGAAVASAPLTVLAGQPPAAGSFAFKFPQARFPAFWYRPARPVFSKAGWSGYFPTTMGVGPGGAKILLNGSFVAGRKTTSPGVQNTPWIVRDHGRAGTDYPELDGRPEVVYYAFSDLHFGADDIVADHVSDQLPACLDWIRRDVRDSDRPGHIVLNGDIFDIWSANTSTVTRPDFNERLGYLRRILAAPRTTRFTDALKTYLDDRSENYVTYIAGNHDDDIRYGPLSFPDAIREKILGPGHLAGGPPDHINRRLYVLKHSLRDPTLRIHFEHGHEADVLNNEPESFGRNLVEYWLNWVHRQTDPVAHAAGVPLPFVNANNTAGDLDFATYLFQKRGDQLSASQVDAIALRLEVPLWQDARSAAILAVLGVPLGVPAKLIGTLAGLAPGWPGVISHTVTALGMWLATCGRGLPEAVLERAQHMIGYDEVKLYVGGHCHKEELRSISSSGPSPREGWYANTNTWIPLYDYDGSQGVASCWIEHKPASHAIYSFVRVAVYRRPEQSEAFKRSLSGGPVLFVREVSYKVPEPGGAPGSELTVYVYLLRCLG